MKKLILLLSVAAMIVLQSGASAQTGAVQDELSMKSEILNMDRKYAIYLPITRPPTASTRSSIFCMEPGTINRAGYSSAKCCTSPIKRSTKAKPLR